MYRGVAGASVAGGVSREALRAFLSGSARSVESVVVQSVFVDRAVSEVLAVVQL